MLANPVLAASGSMGYGVEVADAVDLARLGGLVTRGTTLKPRGGHPAPRTADIPAGLLLGIGLQNPGIESVLERYAPTWARWPTPVIVNLCGESAGDIADMARRLDGVPGDRRGRAQPLVRERLARARSGSTRARQGSLVDGGPPGNGPAAHREAHRRGRGRARDRPGGRGRRRRRDQRDQHDARASRSHADRSGPALASGYGGVCGPALRPHRASGRVRGRPGRRHPGHRDRRGGDIDDVLDYLAAGASAVGVGVAALADPMLPVRLADELADACRARGLADSVSALVGTALPAKPFAAVDSRRGVRPMSPLLIVWLLVINVATAAAYASDKLAARRGDRRIRERTLWLLCLLGGFAGAWIVFFGMRHKTQHQSFWVVQSTPRSCGSSITPWWSRAEADGRRTAARLQLPVHDRDARGPGRAGRVHRWAASTGAPRRGRGRSSSRWSAASPSPRRFPRRLSRPWSSRRSWRRRPRRRPDPRRPRGLPLPAGLRRLGAGRGRPRRHARRVDRLRRRQAARRAPSSPSRVSPSRSSRTRTDAASTVVPAGAVLALRVRGHQLEFLALAARRTRSRRRSRS